ncbi:hypothetical protein FOY51_26425 [Antrihabitans cavernicola]|uniref:Membrane-anchored protein n=2 Tax=Antrihabitans cavernicola TaxID=2495913 RepID=A0A5A7S2T8_9NOCA|nr:hypothetical protein FOY51_26425 [Spelaeibacter cavernicola]
MLNKVPEITLYFWVIKVLATTVGETAADFLNTRLGLGLTGTSCVMAALLIVALVFQFRSGKYVPGLYWLVVVLISVVGTLITDTLVTKFGVPLQTTTIVFAAALAATFAAWYASEKTLSIHSIFSTRREGFYWMTILFTFALGTAAGDLVAERLKLGYPLSALLFAGCIAAVAVAHLGFRLNAVLAFWIAYILTRPLGASLGDLLSQPRGNGGLGVGTMWTSALFLVTILALVTYLTITGKDAHHATPPGVDEPAAPGVTRTETPLVDPPTPRL